MEEKKLSYYQYRKELNYQVFLRFEDADLEAQLQEALSVVGFDKMDDLAFKTQTFKRYKTKILKISRASFNVARQISQAGAFGENYGSESLSPMGNYNIYRYKDVGMMVYSEINPMWELGLKSTSDPAALRCILTRYLSFAFTATHTEVVGFWGVPVEQGVVLLSPLKSNYEAVFLDVAQNKIISYDAIKPIENELEIIRLDQTLTNKMRIMGREELLSFLSVSTCHMSYSDLDRNIRDAIFKICHMSHGRMYPEENFKPRLGEDEQSQAA